MAKPLFLIGQEGIRVRHTSPAVIVIISCGKAPAGATISRLWVRASLGRGTAANGATVRTIYLPCLVVALACPSIRLWVQQNLAVVGLPLALLVVPAKVSFGRGNNPTHKGSKSHCRNIHCWLGVQVFLEVF